MRASITELSHAMRSLEQGSPWDNDTKVSDHFLTLLFKNYFRRLGIPNLMNKRDLSVLVEFLPDEEIDPEIVEKLDAITAVAKRAHPA